LIKNCILVTSALDDWEDAHYWRLAAEQAYTTAKYDSIAREDTDSLEALADLRKQLDQLIVFKQRDLEEFMSGKEDDDEDEDEDEDEDDDEDEGMNEEVEGGELGDENGEKDMKEGNRVEENTRAPAKKTHVLPNRPASEHKNSEMP
jgi:hypothetical protein